MREKRRISRLIDWATSRKNGHRLPAPVVVAIVLGVIGPALILLRWIRAPPPDMHVSGMFQGDMPTYFCYARAAARSHTVFTWANPHDLRPSPAPVFLNLPITVLGWLVSTGIDLGVLEMSLRVVLGLIMYVSLARLCARFFPRGPWLTTAFLVTGFGSGLAWLAERRWAAKGIAAWSEHIQQREAAYYWWFLDSFRNFMYPLELAYHALLFAAVLALCQRRYTRANVLFALGCASNGFLALQMTGVHVGAMLVAPGATRRQRVIAVALAVALVLYLKVLLPLDPTARSIEEQHLHLAPHSLAGRALLIGTGFALLGPMMLVLDWGWARRVLQRWILVPVYALFVWSLVLMLQEYIVGPGKTVMPMHFSRGYLHVSGWILLLAWCRYRVNRARLQSKPWVGAYGSLLFLSVLPDNLSFLWDRWREPPHRPSLMWSNTTEEIYRSLRNDRSRTRHILTDDWTAGRLLCAMSHHRTAFGTKYTTPFFDEREREMEDFREAPTAEEPALVRWADTTLVAANDWRLAQALEMHGWVRWKRSPEWSVYQRP